MLQTAPSLVAATACTDGRSSRRGARHVLELYAGCARLTAACLDEGLQSWIPVDISRGPWHDLTDKNVIHVIRPLIVRREVVHLGTPCTPFSQATPARSRSKHFAYGTGSVSFTVDVLRLCVRFGVKWSVENPSSSRLWQCSEVTSFLERNRHFFVKMHYCHYNCRYLKPTTLVTNLKPLEALGSTCTRAEKSMPSCPRTAFPRFPKWAAEKAVRARMAAKRIGADERLHAALKQALCYA